MVIEEAIVQNTKCSACRRSWAQSLAAQEKEFEVSGLGKTST